MVLLTDRGPSGYLGDVWASLKAAAAANPDVPTVLILVAQDVDALAACAILMVSRLLRHREARLRHGRAAGHARRTRKTAMQGIHAATTGAKLQQSSSLAPAPLCHQGVAALHTCEWTKTQTRERTNTRIG